MEIQAPAIKSVQKDVALSTVYGSTELSLRKQKAIHALTLTVREQFFVRNPQFDDSNIKHADLRDIENTNTTFDIEREEVMNAMGYYDKSKYFSYGQVLTLFEEIADTTLYFDGLDLVRDKPDVQSLKGFTKIISSATADGTKFRFNIPPIVVLRIVNPKLSYLSPVSWNAYTNKYVPGIYESCLYYWQNGHTKTDWFELAYLRRMTGTMTKTYDDYNKFHKRVLEKTVALINESNDFDLHIQLESSSFSNEKKAGRKKVTHVRFVLSEKVNRLSRSDDVRHALSIAALKTELEALGIARSSLNNVLSECCDKDEQISIPFLRWAVRRGNELRSLKRFAPAPKVVLTDEKTEQPEVKPINFGAYLRASIIRDKKEEWFAIQETIQSYMVQTEHLQGARIGSDEFEDGIAKLRKEFKKSIAVRFLTTLSSTGFTHIADDFDQFLKHQMPTYYERYQNKELGGSIVEMAEQGQMCLMIFLDYCHNVFSKEAYQLEVGLNMEGYQLSLIA